MILELNNVPDFSPMDMNIKDLTEDWLLLHLPIDVS